jgi:serine/threonine-protein kinase
MADTCAGLHAAHDLRDKSGELLNVVHRDVSPQNILVSTKGQAKLIDFGIAKARDRVSENTSAGFLKGKILYMAPEQAVGKPVDRRSDVWAIGAVMYHMLAGVPPFEGANQLATLHLLVQDGTVPPLPEHVPPQVSDVIQRALVRDVDARIGTAEELQRMLERAMVSSGHTALQSDVASFVSTQLQDRVDARRKAVNLALEAAKHRQKLQQMLQPPSADSSSGIGSPLRTRHGTAAPSSGSLPGASPPGAFVPDDIPSSATLGSAAVVSARPAMSSRGKQLAIVGSVVAACAIIGSLALGMRMARSERHEAAPVQTSPPVETQPPLPAVTIPPPPPALLSATATTAAPPPHSVPVTTTTATAAPVTKTSVKKATPKSTTASTKTVDDGF